MSNQLTEQEIQAIVDNMGFVQTTSEELNAQDYRPFITADDGTIWTINKEHIVAYLKSLSISERC